MRVWVDCTAAAHPLVLRPIIERLRGGGHEVEITTRELRPDRGDPRAARDRAHDRSARHGGASAPGKGAALAGRSARLTRWARGRGTSTSRSPTARSTSRSSRRLLRIPLGADAGLRARGAAAEAQLPAPRGWCSSPTRSRSRRWSAAGAQPRSSFRYPGLKEDYYLADFEPDRRRSTRRSLGIDRERACSSSCARRRRPPPTTRENPLYEGVLDRLAGRGGGARS